MYTHTAFCRGSSLSWEVAEDTIKSIEVANVSQDDAVQDFFFSQILSWNSVAEDSGFDIQDSSSNQQGFLKPVF